MKTNCETYFSALALTCPSGQICIHFENFRRWSWTWARSVFSFFFHIVWVWVTSINTLAWHTWFRCYKRKAACQLWENWWRIWTWHYQILDDIWPIWPVFNEPSLTSNFGNKLWKLGKIQRDRLAEGNDNGPGGITNVIHATWRKFTNHDRW